MVRSPFSRSLPSPFQGRQGLGKQARSSLGLLDGRTRTLEEVGTRFQLTRERIRQIEAKALRKIRHPSRLRQLDGIGDAA